MENFIFSKLSAKHKKWFIINKVTLFAIIALMTYIAVKITNPVIETSGEKMSLSMGAMLGLSVMALAFFNRLGTLLKVKFVGFLIAFLILFSLNMIMNTLVMALGFVLIPLMIDDIILLPIWKSLWYNTYE